MSSKEPEIACWGMKTNGLILDVICPDEHDRIEGDYTVPLITLSSHQESVKELKELLAKERQMFGEMLRDIL